MSYNEFERLALRFGPPQGTRRESIEDFLQEAKTQALEAVGPDFEQVAKYRTHRKRRSLLNAIDRARYVSFQKAFRRVVQDVPWGRLADEKSASVCEQQAIDFAMDLREAMTSLSNNERAVCHMIMQGHKQTEIARVLQVTAQSVCEIKKRLKHKLPPVLARPD